MKYNKYNFSKERTKKSKYKITRKNKSNFLPKYKLSKLKIIENNKKNYFIKRLVTLMKEKRLVLNLTCLVSLQDSSTMPCILQGTR